MAVDIFYILGGVWEVGLVLRVNWSDSELRHCAVVERNIGQRLEDYLHLPVLDILIISKYMSN